MNWRSSVGAVWSGTEPLSVGAACAFAFLIIVLFAIGFSANQPCLMLGLDGTWYRTMFDYEAVDRAWLTQTGVDALSGNFDAWYPLRPEFLLPHDLALPFGAVPPGKAFIYVVFSTFLAGTIYLVGRSVQAGRATALAAGLLMPVLAAAGFPNSLAQFYPLFEANPYWFEATGLGCLIVAACWAIGGKRRLATALLVAVPSICLLLAVIGLAPHVLFMVPIAGAYSAGSLLSANRLADHIWRIVAMALALAVMALLGVITYYYGIIEYSAYRFFPRDIQHPLGGSVAMSTIFWTPLAAGLIALGIAGALWTVVAGKSRLRLFAVNHLLASAAFFLIAYWLAFLASSYRSSWPVYFETGIWPYALLFSIIAAASALKLVLRLIGFLAARLATLLRADQGNIADKVLKAPVLAAGALSTWFAWTVERSSALILLGIIVAITGYDLNTIAVGAASPCVATGFSPVRATPITRILHQEIALRAGAPFRGIVATIDGAQPGKTGDWIEFHDHDVALWKDTGNDHRSVGLWYFNIPTLFQYHTFITPPYYLFLTDFLSSRADHQLRSSIVMTRIDPALMALWGVRYVITDTTSAAGHEVARLPTARSGTLRLLELSDPNLGNYSPTEAVRAADFAGILRVMHGPDFDGRHTVVVTDPETDRPLVPASNVALVYTKYGFHLTAKSSGHSFLVLPAQYSHCWSAQGSGMPVLFRADGMQLGVGFSGKLDVRLTFRLGPILAGRCRVEDLSDMERLRISQARSGAH